MPYSEAQKRADKKYRAKAYDQLSIRIPKGKREEYKRLAEKRGESLAGMIIRLIAYKMYFNEKRLDAYYRELL